MTYSNSCALDASCRREFEKVCFASSGIIPSQSCIRAKYSVVWRFATSIPYASPSTPRKREFVVLIIVHAQDSVILNDGSLPELGSVLL